MPYLLASGQGTHLQVSIVKDPVQDGFAGEADHDQTHTHGPGPGEIAAEEWKARAVYPGARDHEGHAQGQGDLTQVPDLLSDSQLQVTGQVQVASHLVDLSGQ